MMVVLLGPDGIGKGSVSAALGKCAGRGLPPGAYFHLRPALWKSKPRSDAPVTDPHGRPPRKRFLSIMKIFYFLFAYNAGHFRNVRPQRAGNGLVVFDRYYHDILVDPLRYRYGGPMWLARWIGKLIPKPDLWILLDAPTEVLQARKQEVSFEEAARQRGAYLRLVQSMRNSVVVDASQPLDKVVTDVNSAILTYMAEKTRKRRGS